MESTSRALIAVAARGDALVDELLEAWDGGAAVAPVDPGLAGPARDDLIRRLRPAELWTETSRDRLTESEPVPESTALVVQTSGSTGEPRAVLLSRSALDAAATAGARRLGQRPGDRWLCCLPAHTVGGLMVIVRSLLAGRRPAMVERFSEEDVRRREDAVYTSLVPAMLARLLEASIDVSGFRAIVLGGGASPPDLVARARATGATVVTSYGMTETCGGVVYDGVPLDGVRVRIGAGDRVELSGPVLFSGYLRAPGLTAETLRDGWFTTSDVGGFDDHDRLTVWGRADDVIVSAGNLVAPAEVAAALRTHPGVADAVVLGAPDAERGHIVAAFVVARSGALLAPNELSAHVAALLPPYKAPRRVIVVDELPQLAPGKVDRVALLERLKR